MLRRFLVDVGNEFERLTGGYARLEGPKYDGGTRAGDLRMACELNRQFLIVTASSRTMGSLEQPGAIAAEIARLFDYRLRPASAPWQFLPERSLSDLEARIETTASP